MNRFRRVKLLVSAFVGLFAFSQCIAAESTMPLKAEFKEVRETAFGTYGIYTITNVGQRDIDDVSLSLYLKDQHGEILSSMAVTDATPGLVWLKAGQSAEQGVPLDRSEAARTLLKTRPGEGTLIIEVKRITFMQP